MTDSSTTGETREALLRFARGRGEATIRLAMHAAVAQTIRPDLLHLLRINFVPEAERDRVAESDVLLAPFCQSLGADFYQFDPEARRQLVDHLAATYAADRPSRPRRVAALLLRYLDHMEGARASPGSLLHDYLVLERWVAAAFLSPHETAAQFARQLAAATSKEGAVARVQLGGLAPAIALPLAGFPQLLAYAQALAAIEEGDEEKAAPLIDSLPERSLKVGDAELPPLGEVWRGTRARTAGRTTPLAVPPRFSPPQVPQPFYRIAQAERIVGVLVQGSMPIRTIGITGPDGSGRSAVAAFVAHDPGVASRFPDGVVWLDGAPDPEALSLVKKGTRLVVLDKGEEEDFRRLSQIVPLRSAILMTHTDGAPSSTRLFDWSIRLDDLERTNALELFASWAGVDSESLPAEAEKVIELCHGSLTAAYRAAMLVRAGASWRLILATEPENWEALQRGLDSGSEGDLAVEEARYRKLKDGLRLARVLERRAALQQIGDRRGALYREAAKLYEENGDIEAALGVWRSLSEWDDTGDVQMALARILDRANKFPELVEVLERHTGRLDDREERAELFMRIGQLKAGPLDDLDGAAEALRNALDFAPENPAAMSALAAVEERRGNFAGVEEAFLRQLTVVTGAQQVPVLFELATNASTNLRDLDRALSYLHQLLDTDPSNERAYDEIARLLAEQGRWHDLIELLERRADLEERSGHRDAELATRTRVADIWANQLGSSENAVEVLEKNLERKPDHVPTLLALVRAYEAMARWADARTAVERAAMVAAAGPETAEVNYRLGRISAAEGASLIDVEARYLAALEADPTHAGALDALMALAGETRNSARLLQLLGLRERVEKDEARRHDLLSKMATLYSELGQPADAVGVLQRLTTLAPNDQQIQENLGKAMVASGRIDEGEGMLSKVADQMTSEHQNKDAARVLGLLGTLAESRGDLSRADQRLAASYQLDPAHAPTVAALARVAARRNDLEKARRFYRSLLLQNFDEKAVGMTKADVYFALGRIHVQAGEVPKARNMFERSLALEPTNAGVIEELAKLPH
jgi:tetratricopeptide (TPR) repeat protein